LSEATTVKLNHCSNVSGKRVAVRFTLTAVPENEIYTVQHAIELLTAWSNYTG
jgi:hypothetical protein